MQDVKAGEEGGGAAKKEAVKEERPWRIARKVKGELLASSPRRPCSTPWGGARSIFSRRTMRGISISSKLPVHPHSAAFVASIGLDKPLHPDIGVMYENRPWASRLMSWAASRKNHHRVVGIPGRKRQGGIPHRGQAEHRGRARCTGGLGSAQALMIDAPNKKLYELYHVTKTDTGWKVRLGVIWDLTSNKSARRAGQVRTPRACSIFPGLVRYEEVESGEIRHAIRFTCKKTQRGCYPSRDALGEQELAIRASRRWVWWLRLKDGYDILEVPAREAQVILKAMKKYGIILADNGSDWFFSARVDIRWSEQMLNTLKQVRGSAFEAVDTGADCDCSEAFAVSSLRMPAVPDSTSALPPPWRPPAPCDHRVAAPRARRHRQGGARAAAKPKKSCSSRSPSPRPISSGSADLVALGHQDFAENRVQVLLLPRVELVEAFIKNNPKNKPAVTSRWHMIGHLQRNKVKQVAVRGDADPQRGHAARRRGDPCVARQGR